MWKLNATALFNGKTNVRFLTGRDKPVRKTGADGSETLPGGIREAALLGVLKACKG